MTELFSLAHVGRFAAEQEVVARGAKKSITSVSSRNHASCSVPPGLTMTSPCLQSRCFATKTEVHLAFRHPRDLLISVTAAQQSFGLVPSAESAKKRPFIGASSRNGPSLNSLLPSFGQGAGVRYGCGMREAIRGKLWRNS